MLTLVNKTVGMKPLTAFMQKIILLSFIFLCSKINNAQLTCTILQNDTTVCSGSSLILSVDTTQIVGMACTVSSLPSTLQNGLVAFYPFCGNANDESGNGNNGTIAGATLTTDRFGVANRAYSFNQGNYIIGSASNFPTGTRTVSLWFYATNIGVAIPGPTLIGYGGGNCGTSWFETINNPGTPLGQLNTYQVQGHCNNESVLYSYGATHPNNSWHHWVITTSPSGTKFYIDGALVLSDTSFINETYVQGKDFILGGPVSVNGIGFYSDVNIYGLEGKLDDVFIYNRELTPAQVTLLYQNQTILWSTGATTSSITVAPLQTTTYYVMVSDSITTCTDNVLVTISTVDTSLTVLDPLITCSNNGTVRLRAGIAATYQWLRNGTPLSGASARDYTATQSGAYRVVVRNNTGCTDTTRLVDVIIYPQPMPGFTINNVSQCLNGNNFVFANTSVISNGAMTFNWSFGNGLTASSINATHIYSSPGNYTVKLIASSNNNCRDSIEQIITVTPDVLPTASLAASSTTICAGTSVTFTASTTNGGTSPVYQWQVNGVNAGTNSTTFTSSILNNNDVVSVIMTSNASCASPATATSNTITMTVSTALVPSVVLSASSTTICAGTSVTFSATATSGGSSPTYQWQVNGVNVGTNSTTFTSSNLNNNDVVRVIMTSNAGCLISNNVISNVIVMTVFQQVIPSINIIVSPIDICQGTLATFSSSVSNGGSVPNYQWQINGNHSGSNSPKFATKILKDGDNVNVIFTSSAPCAIPNSINSNTIKIIIDPLKCPQGFFIPSAFTPNKDGKNDIFKPLLFGNVSEYRFTIFNRWGQKVFETNELQKGWDGKLQGIDISSSIFVWLCEFKFEGREMEKKKGTVSLIR